MSELAPNYEASSAEKDDEVESSSDTTPERASFYDRFVRGKEEKDTEKDSKESKTLFGSEKEKDKEKPEKVIEEADDETRELAQEFLDDENQQIEAAKVGASPDEMVELNSSQQLISAVKEKIEDPTVPVPSDVSQEAADVLKSIAETKDIEDAQTDSESAAETDDELGAEEIVEESENITPPAATPTSRPVPLPAPPIVVPAPGVPPPILHAAPTASRTTPTPSSGRSALPPLPGAAAGNLAGNTYSAMSPERRTRDQRVGSMLAAGVVGYMLGRRGGRKKAEAELKPEINKQKKNIKELEKNVKEKEDLVAEAARKEYDKKQAARFEKTTEKPKPGAHEQLGEQKSPEATVEPTILDEEVKQKRQIEEREQVVQQQRKQEQEEVIRIHRSESQEKQQIESDRRTPESKPEIERAPETAKHLEMLSTPALLMLAEKVKVLDTNLRRLYETNQIDRRGVEEVMKEHLAGREIAPVLDKRLLGREVTQERAREYKHDPGSQGDDSTVDDTKEEKLLTAGVTEHLLVAGGLKSISNDLVTDTTTSSLDNSPATVDNLPVTSLQGIKEQPREHVSPWAIVAAIGLGAAVAYGLFRLVLFLV